MNRDRDELITSMQRYLKQQSELYGRELIRERHAAPARAKTSHTASTRQDDLIFFEQDSSTASTEPWVGASTIAELNAQICNCQKCPLGRTRTKFVFGVGNPNSKAVLIGEAPGADEDQQGEPFVGRAGQLLNKILEAIHFRREDVFICNILKCRPPNNRDPLPAEVEQCEPYLHKQLEILQPKIILALGRIAAQTLLRTNESLTKLRAGTHVYRGIPLIATFHPAAILRNPNWKRPTWEDVQKFRRMYDELMKETN